MTLDALIKTVRRLACKFSDRFHDTHHPSEGRMACHHCRARWTQVVHEPDSWLRISDEPTNKPSAEGSQA